MRDSDDPLIIRNERGSRIVRGVQTVIAAGLLKIFGSPMYGTATTLTQTALNQKASVRAARTASTISRNRNTPAFSLANEAEHASPRMRDY
jgi:hypothetical protein